MITKRYRISHSTTFTYSSPVTVSQQIVHLMPRETQTQTCLQFSMSVAPQAVHNEVGEDFFGNPVRYLTLTDDHTLLLILAVSEVEVRTRDLPDPASTMPWEQVHGFLANDPTDVSHDAVQYCFDSPHTQWSRDLPSYALQSFTPGRPFFDAALDLTRRIHEEFRYDPAVTDVTTPVDEAFDLKAGVCQDLAHVQIACMRSLGLPVRYVSGYLLTHPPAGEERMIGADASHAWVSVYCPGPGWIDLDPTNNLVVSTDHITSAWGRDYADVSPIAGVITGGGSHTVDVSVDVAPLEDVLTS
ncbi:transglutaminase family protein [Pyruvatibacter sp.]|uniref:transglutaminase family protein n=1 Tax=Pyruvatibacter sp. TaxID=1981328 RepID=UPI0032EC95CF